MKNLIPTFLLGAGLALALPSFGQQRAPSTTPAQRPLPAGKVYKKKLPADLPQAKLLFVKFSPAEVPAERPKDMPRVTYKHRQHHNSVIGVSNKQLQDAAAKYPYAYRITTLDSVAFYQDQGYKYLLFNSSFNSFIDGTYRGSSLGSNGSQTTMTTTSVDLYIRDLTNNDKYIIDDFSEKFIYYNKGQVGMLLKNVAKQFASAK